MFVKFPLSLFTERLSVEEIGIMLRVIWRCGVDGSNVCFETREHMCQELDISFKKWTASVRKLEQKKLIQVKRRHKQAHRITLTSKTKTMLEGQIDPVKRNNIDLFCRSKSPPKEGEETLNDEKTQKKRVVRKRPTKEKPSPRTSIEAPISEIDKIHRQWLKRKAKEEKQGS